MPKEPKKYTLTDGKTTDASVDFQFGITSRKWEFTPSGQHHTVLSHAPGGYETAKKLAKVILGSVIRRGCVDNLARANMAQIVARAA